MPPSPLLSARRTNSTYLTVTTTINAHRMRETTPNTISGDGGPPAVADESDSFKA
jgi:hypothetical protein